MPYFLDFHKNEIMSACLKYFGKKSVCVGHHPIFVIMKFISYLACFLFATALLFPSCKKDQLLTDSSAKLGFSTDSVLFDTVFTSLGSTTRVFRIYNQHSQPLNISHIALAMGNAAPFKLNVDGISGKSISDV